jgi:hypothetical protein
LNREPQTFGKANGDEENDPHTTGCLYGEHRVAGTAGEAEGAAERGRGRHGGRVPNESGCAHQPERAVALRRGASPGHPRRNQAAPQGARRGNSLPLGIAVLPWIEKDLKFTGEGQTFAIIYDAVQLELGRKQRYGTQIGEDAHGNPFVIACEEPNRVDEYLSQMSLPSLSSYMADVSKYLYNGKPVRLATPEESE